MIDIIFAKSKIMLSFIIKLSMIAVQCTFGYTRVALEGCLLLTITLLALNFFFFVARFEFNFRKEKNCKFWVYSSFSLFFKHLWFHFIFCRTLEVFETKKNYWYLKIYFRVQNLFSVFLGCRWVLNISKYSCCVNNFDFFVCESCIFRFFWRWQK